jgi:hypothetical protein
MRQRGEVPCQVRREPVKLFRSQHQLFGQWW